MSINPACISIKNDKILAFKEKKSCFYFLNPHQKDVSCIEVDGCAITQGIRCDYLVIDANTKEHYVELKGSDVIHAIEQLRNSIIQLTHHLKADKYAFVITMRCPLTGTDIQNLQKEFKKNYNAILSIKKSPYSHSHS